MRRIPQERFMQMVADALDSLPARFRRRMQNVVVLVEDYPPEQRPRLRAPRPRSQERNRPLILGHFIGTPATQKSVFQLPHGPDRVILYQRNLEAFCRTEQELIDQIRLTVIHEVGHFFGLSEDELRHV
jgi:predicted Zn-dependent protease with MMP-like domain